MTEKLKPCPFCGSSAIVDMDELSCVACQTCGADMPYLLKEHAASRWNRRAPCPACAALRKTLDRACELLRECVDALGWDGETLKDEVIDFLAEQKEGE